MSTNEYDFMKQQFLTLRAEISEAKSRIFWVLNIGIVLVLAAGYLAAEHPSAFANAAIPFLLLALMLTFISEQNNISRAGRYIREVIEPSLPDIKSWENWLESNHHHFREVDSAFVIGFSLFFLIFFAITASLTLAHLDKNARDVYVWSVGIAYTLSAFCVLVVLVRHWKSCKAEN